MFYAPSWGTKRGQPIPSEPAIATDLRQLPCFFFSGWAVLAAGALVASIFAVGAAPAAAAPIDSTAAAQVSAFPSKTACLGPALDDAEFSDVGMDTAHYGAVNCIAHYGITAGRGDGTFGAADSVTRSQMALFLSGMSALAGVTLADSMDAGFTDLADTAADRVNAINRLVNGGIMTGSGAGTFSPEASVTRAEMALWLANFMVAITGNDGAVNVVRNLDGTYSMSSPAPTTTDADARDMIPLDHFPDARVTQPAHVDSAISVAFELGITAGYGDNEFKGHRAVTRAEMATFITRTLAHTNVRPSGLTAQHDGDGGIQVSLRDAMFAPVANEPIDVFRSYFPDYAFRADGSCETRYVTGVSPTGFACEIDASDTTTGADGNRDYTAEDLEGGGEDLQVVCGTGDDAVMFDLGSADDSPAVFWVWTGGIEEKVGADTNLVQVDNVSGAARMGAQQPTHAKVSGGLDASKNQLEAQMGSDVMFMLQLLGTNARGMEANAAPDASGNKYTVVIQVNELRGPSDAAFTGEGAANTRNAVLASDDSTYSLGTLVSRTTASVHSPDSSGMIAIPVTYADPDRARDNTDVVVTLEVKAHQVGSPDTTAANFNPEYNTIDGFSIGAPNRLPDDDPNATDDVTDDMRSNGFETRVIFSDDRPNAYMYAVSADAPVYELARGPNSAAGSYVDISALDQYGRAVRGLSINAISDQTTSRFPFVEYFTTRSDGSYRVSYSYSGGPVVETLTAFAAIANQPYDHDSDPDTPNRLRLPDRDTTVDDNRALEEPAAGGIWNLLLPGTDAAAKPAETVFWAYIGHLVGHQSDGYVFAANANTGLLAVDVPNKSFVVLQTEDTSVTPNVAAGPHVYFWDEHDTFQVGTTAVSMALFEEIISHKDVTLGTLTWSSYNYNRPNDRAHWTMTC